MGCAQEQLLGHPSTWELHVLAGLDPGQGQHSQGTAPPSVTPGVRAAGHLLGSVLQPPVRPKTLLPARKRHLPSACSATRNPSPLASLGCAPQRPSQRQPMLLPHGKPGARTAFVRMPTPAPAKTPKQPSALHHESDGCRARTLLLPPSLRAMRHIKTPSLTQEKPGGWKTAPCAMGPGHGQGRG